MKRNPLSIKLFAVALITVALLCTLFFIMRQNAAVHSVVDIEVRPDNCYQRTLTVAADADYDPYSFLDENGEPCGHDVELVYELANRMGCNVELSLLPWGEAIDAELNGGADLVLTMAYAPGAYEGFSLSVPTVNDPFVAFGREEYERVGELYSKRLAVLTDTGCIPGFIEPYKLTACTDEYGSVSEVFDAVMSGKADYAIVRYSVGRRVMAELEDSGITAIGPTLYDNYVCIGVTEGRSALLKELNAAIIETSADGTLAALSDKWLGHYVDTLTVGEYIAANVNILLYAIAGLLLIFLVGTLLISRSSSRNKETALIKLAERDALTGLYNRAACENMISRTLEGGNPASIHALLVIDVDDFKSINDSFGHTRGDDVLSGFAAGLNGLFRAGDITGRLGGDEFLVFMRNCTDSAVPRQKAAAVCALMRDTFDINGAPVRITASVGIAMCPARGASFAALYKSADDALYEAKRRGKGGYVLLG